MPSMMLTATLALAALAAAVPHNVHRHLHHRSHEVAAPIVERTISSDGTCGSRSSSGASCGAGLCCSSEGWCGNSTSYCSTGCQSSFGDCAAVQTTSTTIVTSYSTTDSWFTVTSTYAAASSSAVADNKSHTKNVTLEVSPNGLCGADVSYTCQGSNFGDSCSQYNYCGSNSSYSGEGCQPTYGNCLTNVTLEVSPNGLCGAGVNFTCQGSNFGESCSQWNYCGSNSSYSGDGCQPTYGTCVNATVVSSFTSASAVTISAASYGSQTSTTLKTSAVSSSSASAAPVYSSAPAYSTSSSSAAATVSSVYSAPSAYSTSSSVAASSSVTQSSTSSAPASSSTSSGDGTGYTMYTGDGTEADGWPSQDKWMDFDTMFDLNKGNMQASCENDFDVPNTSDDEVGWLYDSIKNVSSITNVPESFILAVIMQESTGCVRVWTTNYGVTNPGLMQSHDGSGTCNTGTPSTKGTVSTPCEQDQINQMIYDGSYGTSSGDGLQKTIAQAACNDVSQYYKGARIYNSGSLNGNDLGAPGATRCYASDIANRLTTWWTGTGSCTLA